MKENQSPDVRSMTVPQAAEIYRAMNGDKKAQKTVTIQDVKGLENAPTFEKFLAWNKSRIDIVDQVELSR